MKVLIIIPAYNEEKNILNTVNKIKNLNLKDYKLDYIVINDGSIDNTETILSQNKINHITPLFIYYKLYHVFDLKLFFFC